MATTTPTILDLQDISEVAIIESAGEVNRHLALGWLLLGLSSNQFAENGFTLRYHLGWRRSLGEVRRGKSDMEAWLSEQSGRADPAQPIERV